MRRLRVLIVGLALVAVALAVVASWMPGAPTSRPGERVVMFLLLVLTAFLGLEFRIRGEGDRLDLFDAGIAVALISVPGPELLALVVLAKGIALTLQRVTPIKTCFNMAQWGCAAAAGSLVFAALRPPGPGAARDLLVLLIALSVVATINAVAVRLVLGRAAGGPVEGRNSPVQLRGVVLGGLASLALGLISAGLWAHVPGSRLVIPVALVALHLAGLLWAQRQAGTSRLLGLERASGALAGPDDVLDAAPRFLTELRHAFECEGIELHLQLGDGSWTRIASGKDTGAERSAPLVAELLRRESAVRLTSRDGDAELRVLLTAAGWRDCLAVPVCRQGAVVGLLCTHDREGWQGFESGELAVLEAAAEVLGEAVHRRELAQVLREERAALGASEIRWRAVARVLELVARGTPLPEALNVLARTLEQETTSATCAILLHAPGQPLAVVAPSLPPQAVRVLEQSPLPHLLFGPPGARIWVRDLAGPPSGRPLSESDRATLHASGIDLMHVWPLPCSPTTGAAGVLALCCRADATPANDLSLVDAAVRVAALAVDHLLVQDRLAHQAGHDALTDLPNRAVFLDRLRRALQSTERDRTSVLVLFLDIDRFKMVNDSLGHRAGDDLLCAVAARLRAAVRPSDTVARFGGDEFTILCEGIEDEGHALQVVRRVQDEIAVPFPLGEGEMFATTSIGIALGRGPTHAPDLLVEQADAAMYRSKERGGNCFELFDDAMRERAVRRLRTQSALHRAIERGEFHVVYQPTVRLSTGEVEGVEALVRWDRPEHGTVQPNDFVPLAEESGLIVAIGAYVLDEACRQVRSWVDAAPGVGPPCVSVNLSARQLTDPGLVPLVHGALQRNGVDGTSIAFEITETGLMADVGASSAVLNELRDLGVRLYVDDFGTGYSSLTYLQKFPVDGIKVDRSFVSGLGSRGDDDAIVRGVIALAHGLGMVAVAEGVETRLQLERLVELECDVAQGYYLGRPAQADQVTLDLRRPRWPGLVGGPAGAAAQVRRIG